MDDTLFSTRIFRQYMFGLLALQLWIQMIGRE